MPAHFYLENSWSLCSLGPDLEDFIDGAARHSVAQDRLFGVSPMFFVVQVCGFVVSFHLVEVKLVQGAPVDVLQVISGRSPFY